MPGEISPQPKRGEGEVIAREKWRFVITSNGSRQIKGALKNRVKSLLIPFAVLDIERELSNGCMERNNRDEMRDEIIMVRENWTLMLFDRSLIPFYQGCENC